MKTKPLNTALIAAGVLAVGTARAFSLKPAWLDRVKAEVLPAITNSAQTGGDVQVAALTTIAAPAPVPMLAGNAPVPNYRAIVQQFGPAVVGINAQIDSHTSGYQGLAFAIPIDMALKAKDQIVATGKASHRRLGVGVQDMNQIFVPVPFG